MKRLSYLLALAGAFAAPAFAQVEPATPPELPAADDASLDENLKDMERDRTFAHTNTRESRLALEHYGSCVAGSATGEASRVLSMDFTTPKYRSALRLLSDDAAKFCASKTFGAGVLRSANLLFAGEIAEALLEKEPATIGARLAKAAGGPATASYSFTDKVAICVVRSVPGEVAALFATARDSAEETAAINALAIPMGLCAKAAEARKPLSVSPSGLRAMLATAAFRSVNSAKAAS